MRKLCKIESVTKKDILKTRQIKKLKQITKLFRTPRKNVNRQHSNNLWEPGTDRKGVEKKNVEQRNCLHISKKKKQVDQRYRKYKR